MAKINPCTMNNINFKGVKTQEKKPDENKLLENKMTIQAALGLSLVSFCTAAGLVYFTKNTSGLKKIQHNKGYGFIAETLQGAPEYNMHISHTNIVDSVHASATGDIKPRWSALTTNYMPTLKPTITPKKQHTNWRERQKASYIPGIIKQISADIKDYMLKCGIDKTNNKINPEKLDEILTKAVGKDSVFERPFKENGQLGKGRIKEYHSPNGKIYVLETHESGDKTITRLYMTEKDKHLRAYLHTDGSFRLNSYTSKDSHFETTAKGKRWMEQAKSTTKK